MNLSETISKEIKSNRKIESGGKDEEQETRKISRSQIIKYIFNWNYKDEINTYEEEPYLV